MVGEKTMRKFRRGWASSFMLPILLGGAGLAHADYDAAGVYQIRCATCHGAGGEGTKAPPLGPPLRGNALVTNAPAEVLAAVIRNGRSGRERSYDGAYPNMPAFSAVSVTDVEALIEYLKTDLQD